MADLYCVYSLQKNGFTATGRAVITNTAVSRFDDVAEVEQKILDDLKRQDTSMEGATLFLMSWQPISPSTSQEKI